MKKEIKKLILHQIKIDLSLENISSQVLDLIKLPEHTMKFWTEKIENISKMESKLYSSSILPDRMF